MTTDDEVTRYHRERDVPVPLQKKLELLRHFTEYMDDFLTEGEPLVASSRSATDVSLFPPEKQFTPGVLFATSGGVRSNDQDNVQLDALESSSMIKR